MSLSRIVLAGLIVLVGLGIAAGVWILLTTKDKQQEADDSRSHWLEDQDLDRELPPPANAWKPTTWYSDVADGTLFPNQPSPSFRIPADSSLHRAMATRKLEDLAADEPTRPHASFPSNPVPSSGSRPPAGPTTPDELDEIDILSQTPTASMRVAPVPDNLPTTLKMRTARPIRPNRSTYSAVEQDDPLNGITTRDSTELVEEWLEDGSGPAPEAGTLVAAEPAPVSEELGSPGPVETLEQYDHSGLETMAFTDTIRLDYYVDLDAIAISFTGCSVRNSSDVPQVFQTIHEKLEQLLVAQEWHQRALLLDVAGLQVAAAAQIAWELVLDGFVSQSCPEVAPNRVLAVQYDSSRPPRTLPADETTDAALNETVRPALLALAQSFDEAVRMVQDMRASR
jgi:hypothetical protein